MSAFDPGWTKNRRIAILNWRDAGHPQAGGAETYCLAVAKWLAAQGAEVTLVTSRAPGQERRSVEDGVAVHRGGGQFGVYPFVLLWLALRRPISWLGRRGKIDAVLDCQNGLPFFAPLALGRRVPVVLLVHHVHQEQFELHFGKRLAGVGRFLEGPASRFVYGGRPTISVSPSTRFEIRRHLRFRSPIYVVPNGGPEPTFGKRSPSAHPTVVSVGRLVVQKHIDQLLIAVAEARRSVGDLVLHVVGVGPERESLEHQAEALGLGDAVVFHGRVSDEERDAILDQSWIFLSASQREGWGVAVLEAAAHGVPALVRDVPGLRDAVRNGATGWLLPPDRSFSEALVDAVDQLREDGEMDAMAERCFAWARNFSWERTARRVTDILEHEWLRLSVNRPTRNSPDLVTRVEVELGPGDEASVGPLIGRGRLTDEWRLTPTRLVGVLYGTDEEGARKALIRLGLSDNASVSIARSHDLLGDVPPRSDRRVAIAERRRLASSVEPDLLTPSAEPARSGAPAAAMRRNTDAVVIRLPLLLEKTVKQEPKAGVSDPIEDSPASSAREHDPTALPNVI
jgi:glycosyltransferase involved in cell wall biosynthesis